METWRDVPGYEGRYQVSDQGNVKSVARCFPNNVCKPDTAMILHLQINGYRAVWLRMPGSHRKFYVHQLVAVAFLPNPESRAMVNHKDRDRSNNRLENVEWTTHAENVRHRDHCRRLEVESPEPLGAISAHDLPW